MRNMKENDIELLAEEKILSKIRDLLEFENKKISLKVNSDDSIKEVFYGIGDFFRELFSLLEKEEGFDEVLKKDPDFFKKMRAIFDAKKWDIDKKISEKVKFDLGNTVELLNISKSEGLFVLPSIKKNLKVQEVLEDLKSVGTLLNYYGKYFSSKENIYTTLNFWKKKSVFLNRVDILEKAMEAHYEGKFELSIPIFLIHIEALFEEIFSEVEEKWDTKRKRKELERILDEESNTSKLDKEYLKNFFFSHLVNDVMRKINKNEEVYFPNRHKILHGENLDYYKDRSNSTKCIILLDAFSGHDFMKTKEKINNSKK